MNAFNKMLLHTWNIPVISGGRQGGKRRTVTTHVAGNGAQKYEGACSQVRHCIRCPATLGIIEMFGNCQQLQTAPLVILTS